MPFSYQNHFIVVTHKNTPVKCFNSAQQFFVIPAVDENLCVVFHWLCEYGERSSVEFFLLTLSQLLWCHLTLRLLHQPTKILTKKKGRCVSEVYKDKIFFNNLKHIPRLVQITGHNAHTMSTFLLSTKTGQWYLVFPFAIILVKIT